MAMVQEQKEREKEVSAFLGFFPQTSVACFGEFLRSHNIVHVSSYSRICQVDSSVVS